jgi:hypothetical protein
MARINWRRGLVRLWLAATALWLVITVPIAWSSPLDVAIRLCAVPPLAVLLIGGLLAWAISGFRHTG